MKPNFLFILVFLALLLPVVSAADNTTNITPPDPITLSFMGGHMFGENPVEILENSTHLVFIGNTSSKGVNLSPDYDQYVIRVEPAGISDAVNAPDAGLIGAMKWAEKNPFGTLFGATLAAAIMISIKRRK